MSYLMDSCKCIIYWYFPLNFYYKYLWFLCVCVWIRPTEINILCVHIHNNLYRISNTTLCLLIFFHLIFVLLTPLRFICLLYLFLRMRACVQFVYPSPVCTSDCHVDRICIDHSKSFIFSFGWYFKTINTIHHKHLLSEFNSILLWFLCFALSDTLLASCVSYRRERKRTERKQNIYARMEKTIKWSF
jgi:hypothetical protein